MKQLLFIIMLLLATGCTTTHVKSLPKRSPFPIVRESSIMGMNGMFIRSAIIKLNNVKDGEELYTIPEYYPAHSEIKIDEHTVMIYVVVRINNKKKLQYSLWEVYEVKRNGEKYPFRTEHMKYEHKKNGKISHEVQFIVPIENEIKTGSYHVELRDKEGNTRSFLGTLKYKH